MTIRLLSRLVVRRYGTTDFPPPDALLSLCTLENTRGVLHLSGRDVASFLQGILTNDVAYLSAETGSSSIYAGMLTPRGRLVHDMILYHEGESKGSLSVLIDSDHRTLTPLMEQLEMYRLRSDVKIEDISTTHRVCCLFGENLSHAGMHRLDPRLSSLGHRFIAPISSIPHHSLTDAAAYQEWRLVHGVAENRSEIPAEALPLEYNLEALNGVSFSKGCYVGQELTARTHYQGVIRKRLFPAVLSHAAPGTPVTSSGHSAPTEAVASPGGEIILMPDARSVGTLRAVSGKHVLAFLRLEDAFDAINCVASRRLVLSDDGGVEVTPKIPSWWPSSWQKTRLS